MNWRPLHSGARGIVVVELVGVRIDADDAEGVAAILADPSGQIRIHGEAPTLIPHALLLLLRLIRSISLFYIYTIEPCLLLWFENQILTFCVKTHVFALDPRRSNSNTKTQIYPYNFFKNPNLPFCLTTKHNPFSENHRVAGLTLPVHFSSVLKCKIFYWKCFPFTVFGCQHVKWKFSFNHEKPKLKILNKSNSNSLISVKAQPYQSRNS